TVVNNSGTIEAKGLESRGGEIVLNGGDSGVVNQAGQLLADSHAGPGGKITVEGQNIHLAANSRTSATGKTGGGEVYVGGGWQGKDSHIRNASKVVMDKTATVDVSATDAGNGGTAVLWSDDYTNFRGAILAKGGALSGDGGRVETSSHKNLQAFGDVDTSASAGHGGEWLLDPLDVTIVSGDANTGVTESGKGAGGATLDTDTDHVFSPSASGAQVSAQKISDQLNNGTSVTVETHGDGSQAGNITFNADASVKKTAGGDATLTLKADRGISFEKRDWIRPGDTGNGAIVSTHGELNLNLLTGNDGKNGTVGFKGFVRLHLNGGDAFIGPANTTSGNASVSFQNDDTIDAGNITLNTAGGVTGNNYGLSADKDLTVNGRLSLGVNSGVTSELKAGGLLKITAGTGDISFSAPDKSTGGKILIEGKDGVGISADNGHLVMNAADTVKNTINISSSDGPVNLSGMVQDGTDALTLTNVSISSKGQTTLNGTTYWGNATVLSGLNISADGDVNISGIAKELATGKLGGAWATGATLVDSTVTSTNGDVTLTGISGSDPKNANPGNAVTVNNSSITANTTTGKILLNGTTQSITGVKVDSSSFSSASLDVKGVATIQGTGFTLTNSHLLGNLADLSSVTFSSAGSAAGVTNQLDSSIVTAGNRATLLKWHPENMTQIDMGGSAIFDDSRETDKGWVANFTSDTTPNGGWIFNNTKVIAGGTVDLKGAGFTNATVTVSDGDLNINNAGPAMLQGTTFSMANGGVHVHSKAGNINLTNGNISAKNDISLTADNGSVIINGDTITSTGGNISVNADATKNGNVDGVSLGDSSLSAGQEINITGTTGGSTPGGGVAGVKFQGNVNLTSAKNVIDGKSVARVSWNSTSGVLLNGETHVVFVGDTTINAESASFAGFLFNAVSSNESVEFRDGSSVINATDYGNLAPGAPSDIDDLGGMAINAWSGFLREIEFKVSNASLNITSESMGAARGGMMSYSLTGDGPNQKSRGSGYKFTGQGDINIKGTSVKGAGVDLRVLDNRKLNGKFTVNGESESGVGVIVPQFADVNVVNAAISGSSGTGVGIQLNSSDSNAKEINLQGNTLTGTSVSGSSGVQIKGNNVSVTNGTVNGTVSNGTGTGVLLYGNTDYTISGATVTGQSLDGAGVSAGGSLTVNDGAVLKGTVTGSGSGVVINGDLKNTDGRNVVIAGKAESGDGIQIAGNSSLINASLAGESATGTGVNVAQNLTVSGTSTIKGTSDKNTGVSIARNLTVIPVTDSGGAIISQASITGESGASGTGVTLGAGLKGGNVTGISVSGTGVELADNADIKQATLKGNSTKGSGVTVSGKVTLDDATAKALAAGSDSGSGLTLSEGADVHIVQDGTTEPVT
ncbi:TPA: hypothetical protein G8355_005343, partial [Salmonella enterica]|nr:hypothetical protein [Salmonella enterica]